MDDDDREATDANSSPATRSLGEFMPGDSTRGVSTASRGASGTVGVKPLTEVGLSMEVDTVHRQFLRVKQLKVLESAFRHGPGVSGNEPSHERILAKFGKDVVDHQALAEQLQEEQHGDDRQQRLRRQRYRPSPHQ